MVHVIFLRIKCNVWQSYIMNTSLSQTKSDPPPPTPFVLTRLDLCPDIVFITWFMWYLLRIKCKVCNHTLWTPVYLKQRVIPPPPTPFVLTRLDLCPDIVFITWFLWYFLRIKCNVCNHTLWTPVYLKQRVIPPPPTPFVLTRLDLCPDIVFIHMVHVIFPQD